MKAVGVAQIKKELKHKSTEELLEICLRLAKFKKENKELLTYLLFEAHNEAQYIELVKAELDDEFEQINTNSYYYIKKSIRKILRNLNKYARFSQKKETHVELLLYFCERLQSFTPSIFNNVALSNLYQRQIQRIKKLVAGLHEDLQYDYQLLLKELEKD